MTYCTSCGAVLLGRRYCTACGAPVVPPEEAEGAASAVSLDKAPTDVVADERTSAVEVETVEPLPDEDPEPGSRFPLLLLLAVLALLLVGGGTVLAWQRDRNEAVAPAAAVSTTPAPQVTTVEPVPQTTTVEPVPQTTTVVPVPPTAGTTLPDGTVTSAPTATDLPTASPAPTEGTTTTSAPTASAFPTTSPSGPGAGSGSYAPPSSTPFYAVVVASKSEAEGRAAAEAVAPQVQQAGGSPLVFASQQYGSLRCCYWVAAAGPYTDRAAAQAALPTLRTASPGFSDAYVRCVGTAAECPGQ